MTTSHKSSRPARVLLENILSNYAYVIAMGLVTLVFTPIYVRTLGPTQWGMVALCMTLQGILLLLDLGMSQVMPREVARAGVAHAPTLYRAFLRLYGIPAVAVGLIGQLIAPQIAVGLVGNHLPAEQFVIALRLVLIQFMFQFANNAALGYWNGLERQRHANIRLAMFALVKHATALAAVSTGHAHVVAYMIPFACVAAFEFFANWNSVRSMPKTASPTPSSVPSWSQLITNAGGFSFAVLIGMLTSQIDRIYLARNVTGELFGAYVVAANLALAMMQLQSPLQRAFAPRVMAAAVNPRQSLAHMLVLVFVISVLPCLLMSLFAGQLLQLWLGESPISVAGAPVLRWMLIAVAMNAVYSVAYLQLLRTNAFGQVAILNTVILVTQCMFLAMYGEQLSIMAGVMTWAVCGTIQLLAALVILTQTLRSKPADSAS